MTKQLLVSLSLFTTLVSSTSAADPSSTSAFIQSASPTIVIDTRRRGRSDNNNNSVRNENSQNNIMNTNPFTTNTFSNGKKIAGINPTFGRNGIPLFAKKKKDSTVGKGGKVQVKLLKHVPGTGHIGEVVMVAPAFFTNKLQKTGLAVRITDEEVKKQQAEQMAIEKEQTETAMVIKEKLDETKLSLTKKAGPEGHLFGGVGYKMILEELKKDFPKGCLDGKHIKITEMLKSDGKKLRGDIKEIGEYSAKISLLKGISAGVAITVVPE